MNNFSRTTHLIVCDKHRICKLGFSALITMFLYAMNVSADDTDLPSLSFSGFGTLGAVYSSEDKADFAGSLFKPNGSGYSRNVSFDVDSRLGAQVTANFTPKLSAVVQVIAEQGHNNNYIPQVEWANVKYAFTPDFFVRIGRVALPSFLSSDYRKVGYANPWVRPPLELYNLVPVTNNDGIDASYRLHFGEVRNTTQVVYGSLNVKDPRGSKVKVRNQMGIFNTTEFGSLTVRLGYQQAHVSLDGTFFDAFRQFGPAGIAIANKYDCDGVLMPIATIGASYDPGKWFLLGEIARNVTHCFVGSKTAGYVTAGYRVGKFTPYLSYAQVETTTNTSDAGLNIPAAATLNAGLNLFLGASPKQKTFSIGARWDFMRNTDLKLQFDHTRLGAGSPGVLINTQPGFQSGGNFNVFSATIDFVF